MAIIFPNPAGQTPANTFSPTSTPNATTNGLTYIWDGTLGVWTSTAGGGGGGVASIAVTAPITDTGTATAPVIGISAATTAAAGSVQLATSAEAAAGTNATKALTPSDAVPKDASGMTGAALIPGGNDAARPGTPVTGMLRYNDQAGIPAVMEFYDGSGWVTVSTGGAPLNNVIYGTVGFTANTVKVVNHASVDLAKSYIILNLATPGGSTAFAAGAIVASRTATSFTVTTASNTSNTASYFLIY